MAGLSQHASLPVGLGYTGRAYDALQEAVRHLPLQSARMCQHGPPKHATVPPMAAACQVQAVGASRE
jgi:hypothetical protein